MIRHLALKMHRGEVLVTEGGESEKVQVRLPDGCVGVMFVFDTEESAKAFWGDKVHTAKIENDTV